MLTYHIDNIEVIDAFREDCECPICLIDKRLEEQYADAYLGNAAMVPERRIEVNKKGFCPHHLALMYNKGPRLPLALQLHTYLQASNKRLQATLSAAKPKPAGGLFKKATPEEPTFQKKLEQERHSCVICERMQSNRERYYVVLLDLWAKEPAFRELLAAGKGFCLPHFAALLAEAPRRLKTDCERFSKTIIENQLRAMKRLEDELLWFTQKFDYQHKDAPWGTSQDVLPRLLEKLGKE